MTDNDIGPDGAEALASWLKDSVLVTNVVLNQNKIGKGCQALANALCSNVTVKTLSLRGVILNNDHLGAKEIILSFFATIERPGALVCL